MNSHMTPKEQKSNKKNYPRKMIMAYFIFQIILLIFSTYLLGISEKDIALPLAISGFLIVSPIALLLIPITTTTILSISLAGGLMAYALMSLHKNDIKSIKYVYKFLLANLIFLGLLLLGIIFFISIIKNVVPGRVPSLKETIIILIAWLISTMIFSMIFYKTKNYLKNLQGQK